MTPDSWDDGSGYEPYMGRWSRRVAGEFVRALAVPPRAAWLDFGCGTGALSHAVLAHADPRLVVGCDRSAGYVAFARDHTPDPRARFVVAQLGDLPRLSEGFDAVVSGLVLNFLPDPQAGLAALVATARPGATVAVYLWDYAEGMQLIRIFWDAAVTLDPAAAELDEARRFPLCRPEPLRQLFAGARLRDVAVRPIDVPTTFRDFDDFWTPFLQGEGPAPGYVGGLPPARRDQLRDALRERLTPAVDGALALRARAWAARGTVA